jgi:OOP family OmpA-OmpF porin
MMRWKMIGATTVAVFLVGPMWIFAANGDKAEVKGMINSRAGETFIVTGQGANVTVVITDETTTQDKKGIFGLDKEGMSNVVLIPGLKVEVDGVTDDRGRVIAKTITVDGDDLEASEMIQAGLHPTAEQVAANVQAIEANRQQAAAHKVQLGAHGEQIQTSQQNIAVNKQQITENMKDIQEHTNRFIALGEYDVKASTTVHFEVGSVKLPLEDEEQLNSLAKTATGLNGYIVEVTGYADSTGSAEMNTKLSEDRAKAVITYLMQQGGVPVRHIVAPGAMGEYGPAGSNETKEGRSENRRVEVKVLVNRGIAIGQGLP